MKNSAMILGGIMAISLPLMADSTIDSIKSDIQNTQKAVAKKIFSENIEITESPTDSTNWGEWIIKNNNLDTKKWKAAKIKGTSMWGISPIVESGECGAVLYICQHTKRLIFNAEKLSSNGTCGVLKESYKEQSGAYKKVVVPFTF